MGTSRRVLLSAAGLVGLAASSVAASEPASAAAQKNALGLLDVTTYGAVGDNVTLCSDAFDQAMADAQEGDVVYLPPGVYRLSRPVYMKRNVTLLGAVPPPRWPYKSGAPSRIKADTGTWAGDALVVFQDKETSGASVELEGAGLVNVAIDCVAVTSPTAPRGIQAIGHVQDIRVENVSVWNSKAEAIYLYELTRADGSVQICSGWRFKEVSVNLGTTAFSLYHVTDSNFYDCLAVGQTGSGFYLANGSDNHFESCRAVFGGTKGFYLNGNNGSVQLVNCSTDRNQQHGFYLTCNSGAQAILLSNCYARRDGAAGGSYAGLAVNAPGSDPHCPVIVNGFACHVNKDDDGGGIAGPQYGVLVSAGIEYLALTGAVLQGTTDAFSDATGKVVKTAVFENSWP